MLSPSNHHHSIVEATARALWLVDQRLLDERTRDADDEKAIALRLASMRHMDEASCRRIVQFCFGQQAVPLAAGESLLLYHSDKLCDALFELHQGLPVFKTDVRLRHVSRLIDPDILVCLHRDCRWPGDERYNWSAIALNGDDYSNDTLKNGSVDSHIHLGGVLPPLFYWMALMSGEIPLDMLDFSPTDENATKVGKQVWRTALSNALYLRLRLAATVQAYGVAKGKPVFAHLPELDISMFNPSRLSVEQPPSPQPSPEGRGGREQQDMRGNHAQSAVVANIWLPFIGEAKTPDCFAQIRDSTLDLSRQQRMELPLEKRCCPWVDPLRLDPGRGQGCHYAQGERRLLVNIGQILRDAAKNGVATSREPWLQDLKANLLDYLRVRNAFHYKLVHDHGTDGLLRFVRNFDRRRSLFSAGKKWLGSNKASAASPAPKEKAEQHRWECRRRGKRKVQRRNLIMERQRMAAALDMQLHEAFNDPKPQYANPTLPLRAIEMRVTVPDDNQFVRTMQAWLLGIADFLTDHGSLPTARYAQIGLVFHFIKFKSIQKSEDSANQQARRLAAVLRDYPQLRRYIVGIDAAGYERYSAPRQFASAYREIRRLEAGLRPRPDDPRIQLGYTYHAGEDADDMLTALRHIDEAIALLFPAAVGGRIGHALLLGETPDSFYQRRRYEAEVTLGTHLLDLVWAQGKLAENRCPDDLAWLRRRIEDLIGDKRPRIDRCYNAMQQGADGVADVLSETALLQILRFSGNPDQPVTLEARQQWLPILETLQGLLRKQLRQHKVCIEANPTSNLLIGGYSRYQDLPYFRLVEAGLPLSLNTDDPGLFFSNLPGEFSAMYHGLAAAGMTHRAILDWLEQRLTDARRASFLSSHVPVGAASPVLDEQRMRELLRPELDNNFPLSKKETVACSV